MGVQRIDDESVIKKKHSQNLPLQFPCAWRWHMNDAGLEASICLINQEKVMAITFLWKTRREITHISLNSKGNHPRKYTITRYSPFFCFQKELWGESARERETRPGRCILCVCVYVHLCACVCMSEHAREKRKKNLMWEVTVYACVRASVWSCVFVDVCAYVRIHVRTCVCVDVVCVHAYMDV